MQKDQKEYDRHCNYDWKTLSGNQMQKSISYCVVLRRSRTLCRSSRLFSGSWDQTGIVMMKRQGLGTVKHVATQYLWIQELMHNKEVELRKVPTTENYADLMTKSLAEAPMNYLLSQMGFVVPMI